MGDRCTVVITVHEKHFKEVTAYLGPPDEIYSEPGSPVCEATWYEINYGFSGYKTYPDANDLIFPGIPYVGHHTAGEQYPSFIFASDGTTHLDQVAIDGLPVQDYMLDPKGDGSTFVPCSPDLLPRFLQHYARCHALVFKEPTT